MPILFSKGMVSDIASFFVGHFNLLFNTLLVIGSVVHTMEVVKN